LRFKTLNQRRHDKKKLIIEERSKIIDEEENLRGANTSSLSQNIANSSIANPQYNSTAKTPMNLEMF
jgi:hypothetical protein